MTDTPQLRCPSAPRVTEAEHKAEERRIARVMGDGVDAGATRFRFRGLLASTAPGGAAPKGPVLRPPFVKFSVPVHGARVPRYFVFHTPEEDAWTIERLASFFRATPDQLGISYATEKNGRMGSIGSFNALVYHVHYENSVCIGCEQQGYHSFTRVQWFQRKRQLWAAAWLAAWVNQQLGIPLRHGAAGRRWIVPRNDHIDCGAGFPLGWVLEIAAKWRQSGVPVYVRAAIPKT
jgi:hypothetical protein